MEVQNLQKLKYHLQILKLKDYTAPKQIPSFIKRHTSPIFLEAYLW